MFLETIGYENGEAPLLEYHRRRVINTLQIELSNKKITPKQESTISSSIPVMIFLLSSLSPPSKKGRYKCQIVYNPYNIEEKIVEFTLYEEHPIKTLQMVNHPDIVYERKYSDRSQINNLFEERRGADDILIIRQGIVTDTSYCNIVFFNGKDWITPTPLLPGVQRAHLIKTGVIRESLIGVGHLNNFKSFKLINALRDFDRAEEIPIENIFARDYPIL